MVFLCCMQVQGSLLEALGVAYQHDNAAVRRAAIDCIVEMQMKFGTEGTKQLTSQLSSSQAKIVQVYHEKVTKERQT